MNLSFLSLANAWQLLGWTMILFLAVGTIVFLVGGALRVVLKRANPSARYATSLATFAMLALLPLAIAGSLAANIEASLPRQWGEISAINPTRLRGEEQTTKFTKELPLLTQEARLTRQRWEFSREAERVADELAPTSPIVALNPGRDARAILYAAATYLPWLWIVGTPLTFLLLATGLIGAERLRSSCQLVGDGPIRTACDELRAALGIGRQVGVAICERIATPLLVGVVKPLILLPPAALNGWTTAELEMVLVHELAHVRRWDNAVNLAQRIVEALLFFHPAVWIVSGWVRRDREDCCDAIVVAHTAKPQAYAELLLALASHTPGLAASAALAQHPVAGRIRRILKLEDEPMLVTRKGFAIGVFAAIAVLLLAFALPTTDAEEASPASRKRERPENTASATGQRVADERAETTNPTRQRGEEQTTKATNDTNPASGRRQPRAGDEAELNAEDTKSPLTEYTVTYDVAGAQARFAELVEHLRGVGECRLTSDNDDQIVVTARRSVHEKVANFLASIRDPSKKTTSGAPRPIIYAEQTEKLPDGRYKFSFLVPWVRAVDDPARRANTEVLIKSDLILSRALKEMDLLGGAQSSVMDSLRKDLSVHYSPEGHMFVALTGAKDGEAAVAAYAAHIINEYLKEHATHLAHNQHDLATEDHQYDLATTIDVLPPSEKQVSRDAEQVADDRYGTTNPTRQRGEEQTTNPTNDTNQELATEDTEKTKEVIWQFPPSESESREAARQRIIKALQEQGFEAKIIAVPMDDDKNFQEKLAVTVPDDVDVAIVWEEHSDGMRARVKLFDKSGKLLNPPTGELELRAQSYPEQTTNPASPLASRQRQRPEVNAEDAKSAKDAEKSPNKDDDSVQIAVVYALYDDEAEIKRWLKTIDELSDTINMFTKDGKEMVVVSGTRKGHEKLAALLEGIRGEASRQRQRPEQQTTNDTKTTKEGLSAEAGENSKFPTLAEQRAADLAYKLLGVELEKLSPEELERVKAKGYKGGVKVGPNGALGLGDLLVGLHVWPTESLEQVVEILQRDDLDQLSPLKFYVVRSVDPHSALLQPDELVTGRIQVDLDAWRAMREPALQQLVALEKQIQAELAEKENLRNASTAKDREKLDAEGRAKLDGERAMLDAEITQLREILNQLGRKIATRTPQKKETISADEKLGLLAEDPGRPVQATSSNPFGGETDLLYDGKTFDEWRSLWKSELKTEKRVECIWALAAFGRAGEGKEAAKAILEVAAEYDFGKGESSSVTDLKSAISQVLGGTEGIDGQYWLPLLIERIETDPDKWGAFAEWVLSDASGKNIAPYLKQLASDTTLSAHTRGAALAGLAGQSDVAEDPEAVTMVREALKPEQFEQWTALSFPTLAKLRFQKLDLFPEQIKLFFNEDEQVRERTLEFLNSSAVSSTPLVVEHLLAILDDPARKIDHAQAIHALPHNRNYFNSPGGRKHRNQIMSMLGKLLVDGDNEILPVTLRTMSSLSGVPMVHIISQLGDKVTDKRREQLQQIAKEIEKKQQEEMGNGGMGGGGAF